MERQAFSEALEGLRQRTRLMASIVEDRLTLAVDAVLEQRVEVAHTVLSGDNDVNSIERELDEMCVRLIAQQQPVARDLRLITSVMKVATDLERVGDQAVNIAGAALRLAEQPSVLMLPELARIAACARKMLRDAVEAYLGENVALAQEVLLSDDEVDSLRDQIFRLVVHRMMADPRVIEPGLGLILVSRNLERVADHATNIAEDVVFLVEARDVRHLHEPS